MLLAKKKNFVNDSGCVTSRDNEHKRNINLLSATRSTGMFSLLQKLFYCLSNDQDKNCSIFYCSAAIRFPHIEMVVFTDEEFINRWKAGLWNKMYLNSILKGSFLCVKTFEPITIVVNKDKSFQFSNVPHIWLLWYSDSEEILLKGR